MQIKMKCVLIQLADTVANIWIKDKNGTRRCIKKNKINSFRFKWEAPDGVRFFWKCRGENTHSHTEHTQKNWWTLYIFSHFVLGRFKSRYRKWGAQISFSSSNGILLMESVNHFETRLFIKSAPSQHYRGWEIESCSVSNWHQFDQQLSVNFKFKEEKIF